jgi:hypothetical protein
MEVLCHGARMELLHELSVDLTTPHLQSHACADLVMNNAMRKADRMGTAVPAMSTFAVSN